MTIENFLHWVWTLLGCLQLRDLCWPHWEASNHPAYPIWPLQRTAAAAKSLQSCPTLRDPIDGSPRGSPCAWDSPGKNTGVGCHFLIQCMKMKSESEVAQSCPTRQDPMDCSLPGSSVHGIFQARVLEWGAIAFSRGLGTLNSDWSVSLIDLQPQKILFS